MAGLPETLGSPTNMPSPETDGLDVGQDPFPHSQEYSGQTGSGGEFATTGADVTMHDDDGVRPVEVFVGGLQPDIDEATIQAAFHEIGEISDVQIRRTKGRGAAKIPCGIAFVCFKDPAAADAAVRHVKEIKGRPVAVHLSKARLPDDVDNLEGVPPLHLPSDPTHTLSQLLPALRGELHKRAAVSLALKELSEEKEQAGAVATHTGSPAPRTGGPSAHSNVVHPPPRASTPSAQSWIMDSSNYLENFPLCNQLMQRFSELKTPKTPMSILHEYATRSAMQISYEETAEGALGPFLMEAKLTDPDSNTYHTGVGRGKTKKDAKQFAAATVLEQLLTSLPQSAFLGGNKSAKKPPTKLAPGLGYDETRSVHPHRRGGRHGGRRGGSVPIKFVRGSEVTLPTYSRDYVAPRHLGSTQLSRPMQPKVCRPLNTELGPMQSGGEVLGHKRSFSAAMNELPPSRMDIAGMGHHGQEQAFDYSAQMQTTITNLSDYAHEAPSSAYYSSSLQHPSHPSHMARDQGILYLDSSNAGIAQYSLTDSTPVFHPMGPQSGYEHSLHAHHHHGYNQHY